jgi:CHAT domain-containing protein/tetratricopeptide (TPR) repeat protein
MRNNLLKKFNLFIYVNIFLIISSITYAEFEKEIKLTDDGKCEEALEENRKTSLEDEEKYGSEKTFTNNNLIKIFRVYSLNRRIDILNRNCKKKKEAYELAKKSLELEKELFTIPLADVKSIDNYEFDRKKNLAGAFARLGNFYIDFGDLEKAIKLYEKNIEISEDKDLINKENLLNYNYSILSSLYNKSGDLKKARILREKHLVYMKTQYGEKTFEYFDAYFQVYNLLYDQGYYDFALQTLLEIQKIIDLNLYYKNDIFGELKFNHELATIYFKNNNYDKSIEIHNKNLLFIKSKKNASNTLDINNKILRWELLIQNDIALNLTQKFESTANEKFLNDAEKTYLDVLKVSENSKLNEIKNEVFITKDNLSGIYLLKNQFDKALPLVEDSYIQCIKKFSERDERCLGQMISLANVTSVFNLNKSIEILEKFLVLEPKSNRSFIRQRVNARGSLSVMYAEIGNNKKAQELMIESVNLIDPTDSRFRDVYALTMNDYYLFVAKSGQPQNAINGYIELIKFIDENISDIARIKPEVVGNLGFSYSLIEDTQNALKFYLEAEMLGKKFKNNRSLSTTRSNIAERYFLLGDYKKANQYYKLALENSQFSSPKSKIILYAGLSKTEAFNNNYDQALFFAKEGLKISEKNLGIKNPSNLILLDSLALANSGKKNNKEKFQNLNDIYNIINDYSKGYLNETSNIEANEYFAQIWSFLYVAADKFDNKGEDKQFKNFFKEKTFDTIENAIFNLTETLRTTQVSVDTGKMLKRNFFEDTQKQEKLRLLDLKIEEYSKIPMYASNQEEKKELVVTIEKARKEIEILKNELELGKLLKGDSFIYQDINIKQVQSSLKNNEAILYYISYEDTLYYGIVTKNDFKFFYKYYNNNKIPTLVKKLRTSINYNDNNLSQFDFDTSAKLYAELIKPFEKYLKDKEKLIIVPHGSLLSIPFEILVSEIPKDNSFQNSKWLIKKHNIVYYPSISSFYVMKNFKKKEIKNNFVGFGDPKLMQVTKETVVENVVDVNKIFQRGVVDVNEIRKLPELPKTSDELKAILKYFGNGDVYLKDNFNEKTIKSINLSKYNVLSFATHGVVANELTSINESGLITTPPSDGSIEDDGILTSSEIKKLNLDADLVILSACNTAGGDNGPSAEGLSGLASSFFYAGARSLLVSHWYVEDNSTADLMKNTFTNLKRNLNFSDSLRETKITMINDNSTSHPIFWAPFVLVGGTD